MTRVVLHIDRVVLNGYSRRDRHAIVAGLREEFARRYSDPREVRRLQGHPNLDRLHAGRVSVADGAAPAVVGRQVAGGIAKGLAS
jgi:hypothetical protein